MKRESSKLQIAAEQALSKYSWKDAAIMLATVCFCWTISGSMIVFTGFFGVQDPMVVFCIKVIYGLCMLMSFCMLAYGMATYVLWSIIEKEKTAGASQTVVPCVS